MQRIDVTRRIKIYEDGQLEPMPGRTVEETLEMQIMQVLGKARDQTGQIAGRHLGLGNSAVVMAVSGARGSMLNLTQMAGCIGQQSVRGERIVRGYDDRTLPHFKKGDRGSDAHGFIQHSYKGGLNPTEFFFHAIGGREGLVDTAVRTSQSGYLQRRMINALQDLKVAYDGTVRSTGGRIIQFQYGEDSTDPTKSAFGDPVDVKGIVEEYLKGGGLKMAVADKYDKKIEAADLPQKTKDQLRKFLEDKEITDAQFKQILDRVVKEYLSTRIEACEAVGVIAAQSIGEPGTQMTMRTFHYAGVAEINVTLGLPASHRDHGCEERAQHPDHDRLPRTRLRRRPGQGP